MTSNWGIKRSRLESPGICLFRFPELSALKHFPGFQPSTPTLAPFSPFPSVSMEVDLNRDVSNFEEVKKRVLAANVGP